MLMSDYLRLPKRGLEPRPSGISEVGSIGLGHCPSLSSLEPPDSVEEEDTVKSGIFEIFNCTQSHLFRLVHSAMFLQTFRDLTSTFGS